MNTASSTTEINDINPIHPLGPSLAEGAVQPLAVSLADAARLLNVSEMTLSKAIGEGTIAATKITTGRSARWIIPMTEIHRVLSNAVIEAEARSRASITSSTQPERDTGEVIYGPDAFNGYQGDVRTPSGFGDDEANESDDMFMSADEIAEKRAAEKAEIVASNKKRQEFLRKARESAQKAEANHAFAQAHMDKRVAEAVKQARAEIARGEYDGFRA